MSMRFETANYSRKILLWRTKQFLNNRYGITTVEQLLTAHHWSYLSTINFEKINEKHNILYQWSDHNHLRWPLGGLHQQMMKNFLSSFDKGFYAALLIQKGELLYFQLVPKVTNDCSRTMRFFAPCYMRTEQVSKYSLFWRWYTNQRFRTLISIQKWKKTSQNISSTLYSFIMNVES